jgi:hypothetical protein
MDAPLREDVGLEDLVSANGSQRLRRGSSLRTSPQSQEDPRRSRWALVAMRGSVVDHGDQARRDGDEIESSFCIARDCGNEGSC